MSSTVIEVVTFHVKVGVSQEQLMNASSAFTQMLQSEIAGFQKRTLTQRSDSDLYVEMLWWDSMEAAQAALETAPKTQAFCDYASLLEEEGSEIYYLNPIQAAPFHH